MSALESIKKKLFPWLLSGLLCGGLTGCSTVTNYQPRAAAGTPTPASYPIPVYTPEMQPPRPCIVIGDLSIGHTPLTIHGGAIDDEMEKVMKQAHARGADAVQIVTLNKPDFATPDYSVAARLLRYGDVWESVALSETGLADYLRAHQATLDPIEGIWSDGLSHRLGIVRNASQPGRDFIAFELNPESPAWKPGFKKMDLSRDVSPGGYQIKYYKTDFSWSDVVVTLEQNCRFQFILNFDDQAYQYIFTKLKLPPPSR